MTQRSRSDNTRNVRIPLVGAHTTRRVTTTLASQLSSGIVGIGVVGKMIVGQGASLGAFDQRFLNAVPNKRVDALTGSEKYYVYKRSGVEEHTTPATGVIASAVSMWFGQGTGDKVISAFGATNSTIYDGTVSLGTLTGQATFITTPIIAATANIVIPCDNSKTYYYPEGGAMTEVTDGDYPGNAGKTITGNYVHVDGFSFIMTTDARIYNSDLGSIANWTATSWLTAQMYPDAGIGLARYKEFIVAFGKNTMEFFKNVGNTSGSPLQRQQDGFFKIGAIGPQSIVQVEDTVAWVSASDLGSTSVYMIENGSPKRVSSDAIDMSLAMRGNATVYMSSAKLYGKTFVFVMVSDLTFVYCVEDKMWHEWESSGDGVKWHQFTANSGSAPYVLYCIGKRQSLGKVYKINQTAPVYADDGSNYAFTIQTIRLDLDTERRKFLDKLSILGDKAISTLTLSISYSDDDYNTFSTARTVDLANDRTYLTSCGSFRRRAYKLTNTSSLPIRLDAMEFEVREGWH